MTVMVSIAKCTVQGQAVMDILGLGDVRVHGLGILEQIESAGMNQQGFSVVQRI